MCASSAFSPSLSAIAAASGSSGETNQLENQPTASVAASRLAACRTRVRLTATVLQQGLSVKDYSCGPCTRLGEPELVGKRPEGHHLAAAHRARTVSKDGERPNRSGDDHRTTTTHRAVGAGELTCSMESRCSSTRRYQLHARARRPSSLPAGAPAIGARCSPAEHVLAYSGSGDYPWGLQL